MDDVEEKINSDQKETRFWSSSEDQCLVMAKNQGWALLRTNRHGRGGALPVECVFRGQVEFEKTDMDGASDD